MDISKLFRSKVQRRLKDKLITPQVAYLLLADFQKTGKIPSFMEEWETDEKEN